MVENRLYYPPIDAYVEEKVAQGWTPDVITGREEHPINCSVRTLYRLFKRQQFDISTLPMKGKRKPNGHKERRGRQTFKRNISERETDYPAFNEEFGHLEGDTIVGVHHKSAIITLVERLSKAIITLKPEGRTAKDIETTSQHMVSSGAQKPVQIHYIRLWQRILELAVNQ